MEITEKQYIEHIDNLSRIIFTTALSKGTDDYEQNIYEQINTTVDVLDVIFPNDTNYIALTSGIRLLESKGVVLTIDCEAMNTSDLFKFEEIKK